VATENVAFLIIFQTKTRIFANINSDRQNMPIHRVKMTNQAEKKWLLLLFVTGFVCLIFYIGAITSQLKPTPDSCEYMGLARSLVTGQGYQFNGRSQSRYPPGLPMMIAGLNVLSEETGSRVSVVILAKIMQVTLALLMALGGWRLARHYLDQRLSALVGILIWANLFVFQHCMFILSDVLYGCLSVWGLVLLQDKITQKRLITALVFISLAWLTRSIGLLLVAAVFAGIIFSRPRMFQGRRRWIWAILAPTLSAILSIVWKIWGAGAEGGFYLVTWIAGSGQNNLLMAMLISFKTMAPLVAANSVQTLLNIETSGLPLYFTVVLFGIWILGWWQNFRLKRGITEWYVLFYLGLMSVWFADQGPRFYLPLLPMMLVYGITGLKRIAELYERQSSYIALIRIAVLLGLVCMMLPLNKLLSGTNVSTIIMFLTRNGYIYCLLAALVLIHLLITKKGFLRRFSPWHVGSVGLLLIYLGIGLTYGVSYLVLERQIVTSRGPMLAGYQPYWQMGDWLKNQQSNEQPVLAAQSSIVHHAGGRIIREPQMDDQQTWRQLNKGDYTHVLWLYYPLADQAPGDRNNDQIGRLIRDNPDNFVLQSKQGNDPEFRLYIFVPPGTR